MQTLRNIWNKMDMIGTYVLLLPFLMVQMIGPGAMPQIGPDGVEIVLCSDGDLVVGTLDTTGNFHEGEGEHFSPCDWAVTGAPLVQTAAVQLPALLDTWTHFSPTLGETVLRTALNATLPPARGPPLTV